LAIFSFAGIMRSNRELWGSSSKVICTSLFSKSLQRIWFL